MEGTHEEDEDEKELAKGREQGEGELQPREQQMGFLETCKKRAEFPILGCA